MKQLLHTWRWLALSAAIGLFGFTAACGKMEARPAEEGPRVVSISGSAVGMHNAGTTGTALKVSMAYGSHALNFDLNVSQAPSFSPAQRIENTDYVLQAVCVDIYCDRVGFLLQMTTYGYTTGVGAGVGSGYGSGNNYITGRSAKAYLFRTNLQGSLEQMNAKVGNYQTLSEAMMDLGAF